MEIIIIVSACIINAGLCAGTAKRLLHSLQQNNYGVRAYFKSFGRNFSFIKYQYIIFAAGAALAALFYFLLPPSGYGLLWLSGLPPYFIMLCALLAVTLKVKTKKPLALTKRMKRLWVTLSALCLTAGLLSLALLSLLVPLAALINAPLENIINNGYIKKAKNKLENIPGLIKIGVTGSYGKTSVKFYLAEMLKSKYRVCASPQSYNTPLGMARVINDILEAGDGVLIAEMGARNTGDIKFLCDMVKPSFGILTAIGAQHLETFKCIGNIIAAKYELIENLYGDKTAVFNCDNEYVKLLFDRTGNNGIKGVRKISAGADKENAVYYTVDSAGPAGSAFSLYIEGRKYPCASKLLGVHNISNLCAAAAAACALGIPAADIVNAVSRIEPAEHRLQLIKGQNGITVIDDAYNSNPGGARAALDVLAVFPNGKIVVTPGLAEMGLAQYSENKALGAYIAGRADYCLAVGENAAAIKEGFLEAELEEGERKRGRIIVCGSLNEAQGLLAGILKPGDTVLFENDIPDV